MTDLIGTISTSGCSTGADHNMGSLTGKSLRTLEYARKRLFKNTSWVVPKGKDDLLKYDYLERKVDLSDHRVVLLTDDGNAHFRTIVDALFEADAFDGLVNYADIWTAARAVLGSSLSTDEIPDDAAALVKAIRDRITPTIQARTYIVPIYGVFFEEGQELVLGRFSLRSFVGAQDLLSTLDDAHGYGKELLGNVGHEYAWLSGTERGTDGVAEEQFRSDAKLTLGMLAAFAASRYEAGGLALCLGTAMSPHEAYGYSGWLSWGEERSVRAHRQFVTRVMRLTQRDIDSFCADKELSKGLAVVQSGAKTDLEGAIVRATYWFGDAQRDQERIMQLVKYWSCIEAFFSMDSEQITKDITLGLASVLAFGGYQFVDPTDYARTRSKAAKLYGLRSKALHRAAHDHVTDTDVMTVSKWSSWLIINMISLLQRGYTTRAQILELAKRLDRQSAGGPAREE